MKPLSKTRWATFCFLLVVSAYGMELFDRLHTPPKALWGVDGGSTEQKREIKELARQYGHDFDTRDSIEVISDLRQRGVEAVFQIVLPLLRKQKDGRIKSAISSRGGEVFPLGGISNMLVVPCNESGEPLIYRSDEHGFHNPKGIWQAGSVEVAILGNSFTLGYCVPSDRNFSALVRRRYRATLNLGMSGDDPLLMLATLKEYLPGLKPKVVLWFYAEGDQQTNQILEMQRETGSQLLMRYLIDGFSQGLIERQSEINDALTNYVKEEEAKAQAVAPKKAHARGSRSYEWISVLKLSAVRQKLGLVRKTGAANPFSDSNMSLFREILSRAKAVVSGWKGTLDLVYLPSWARYADPGRFSDQERARVLALAQATGIQVIDVHPAFEREADPLSAFPFRRFGHYNEKGQRIVAEEVLKRISPG